MSRIRLFTLLTAFFLAASAAWADDLGYVDCTSHPDATPVFSKARQTPDTLGAVPCGERFTVLVYGFVFSRVQTKDGKIGYIYSSVITVDRGGAAASQSAAVPNAPAAVPVRPAVANAAVNSPAYAQPTSASQAASLPVTTSLPSAKPAAAPAGSVFPTPPQPASDSSSVNSAPAQAAPATPAVSQPAQSAPAAASQPQPAATQAATTHPATSPATPATAAPAPAPAAAPSAQPSAAAPSHPSAPTPVETQPSAAHPAAAQSSAPAQPGPLFPTPPPQPAAPASDTASAPAPAAPEPTPAAVSESQPEAVQPAPVRDASARSTWERPLPGVHQNFLLDLYSGYAFARFTSGGSSTNLNGGMGSFAYNLKPWLQIGGDTSYNFVTISGTKNTLYGNHFGGRFFYHRGARWGFTPFVEALVGGSRLDTSSGGVKTSQNCISYKAGGGIDIRVKRHWEIRLINVDYYRTTFGAGSYTAAQNNYWATAGVVLRLFGSGASE